MSVRTCTLMWGTAWDRYGYKFADTYTKCWDPDIDLVLVTDKEQDFDRANQMMLGSIPGYQQFVKDFTANPMLRKDVAAQHQWKYDAMKWAPQAVTPHAILTQYPDWKDGDIFVWMDADCEFHSHIDEAWIERVLGDYDVACLQRKPVHTEIGFYAMRLNEKTRAALKRFHDHFVYRTVFELDQWHSAFVWDEAVEVDPNITINNLNTTNDRTHVFPLSILAEKIVHHKGHRKPGGG